MKFELTKTKELQAQLVIVVGLLIIALIFKWQVLIYIVAILGLIFLLIPFLGHWIVVGWFKLAEGLGWVNSRILLTLIFFLLLLPIALFYRLFSKDPLRLKNKYDSMFIDRNHKFESKDLLNPW